MAFAARVFYQVDACVHQKTAADWHCAIHAYVIMTNHVHLLVTPETETGIAKLMQAVGRCYVQCINRTTLKVTCGKAAINPA